MKNFVIRDVGLISVFKGEDISYTFEYSNRIDNKAEEFFVLVLKLVTYNRLNISESNVFNMDVSSGDLNKIKQDHYRLLKLIENTSEHSSVIIETEAYKQSLQTLKIDIKSAGLALPCPRGDKGKSQFKPPKKPKVKPKEPDSYLLKYDMASNTTDWQPKNLDEFVNMLKANDVAYKIVPNYTRSEKHRLGAFEGLAIDIKHNGNKHIFSFRFDGTLEDTIDKYKSDDWQHEKQLVDFMKHLVFKRCKTDDEKEQEDLALKQEEDILAKAEAIKQNRLKAISDKNASDPASSEALQK